MVSSSSPTLPPPSLPAPEPAASSQYGGADAVDGVRTPIAPLPAELLDYVRRVAQDEALIASLPLDPEGRTWLRLDGPGGSEAWLIGWPPGTGTGWHDHAESYGAFHTARGALTEYSLAAPLPTEGWRTLELADGLDRTRNLSEGQGRAFSRQHLHEVLNESADRHAVSVHAYYPPLPQLRRYSRSGSLLRLEHVERPEDWQ